MEMKSLRTSIVAISFIIFSALLGLRPEHARAKITPHESKAKEASALSAIEVLQDTSRNVLKIRNQTPFMVIVYISGIRIGWMKPYRIGTIRGLKSGYHKLYAHSRNGSTSWGPREIWVPGSWNILY